MIGGYMSKELSINIERLDPKNRSDFEMIFSMCNEELNMPLDSIIPDFIYQAGTNDGLIAYNLHREPIGYLLYNLHNDYFTHLVHFWVFKDFRRQNIATRLLAHMIIKEKPCVITAMVDEYLTSAHMFLKHMRFRCIKIVKSSEYFDKYYFSTADDGRISRFKI